MLSPVTGFSQFLGRTEFAVFFHFFLSFLVLFLFLLLLLRKVCTCARACAPQKFRPEVGRGEGHSDRASGGCKCLKSVAEVIGAWLLLSL